MEKPMRCLHCGDIIGVYEPLVALSEGRALETSLAAGTVSSERDASCYHRHCYVLRHDADALDDRSHASPAGGRQ
jgi:hypothetical protein